MNDADLVAAAHAAFNPYVLEQLSSRIGLPPDTIRLVVERAAPGIVLTMMARAGSAESAQRLFIVLMSTESNPRIAAQLAGLTASSHGLKAVERSGHALATRIADSREIAMISDHIAALTAVPPQATHALTDVASAVVFGAAKHHMLLEQGSAGDLPGLLAYQWPIAAPWLAEGYAKALGFESSAAFAASVPQRLVELAAVMPRESVAAGNGAPPTVDAARSGGYAGSDPYGLAGGAPGASAYGAASASASSAARTAPGAPAQLLTTVEPSAPRPRRVPVWAWGILAVIVLLIGIIVYGYRQRTGADEGTAQLAGSTASGALSTAVPVSGASAPPAAQTAADSGRSGTAAASEAVASSEAASATGAAAAGGAPASNANPASAASQ